MIDHDPMFTHGTSQRHKMLSNFLDQYHWAEGHNNILGAQVRRYVRELGGVREWWKETAEFKTSAKEQQADGKRRVSTQNKRAETHEKLKKWQGQTRT